MVVVAFIWFHLVSLIFEGVVVVASTILLQLVGVVVRGGGADNDSNGHSDTLWIHFIRISHF